MNADDLFIPLAQSPLIPRGLTPLQAQHRNSIRLFRWL